MQGRLILQFSPKQLLILVTGIRVLSQIIFSTNLESKASSKYEFPGLINLSGIFFFLCSWSFYFTDSVGDVFPSIGLSEVEQGREKSHLSVLQFVN